MEYVLDKNVMRNTPRNELHALYNGYFKKAIEVGEQVKSTTFDSENWMMRHLIGYDFLEIGCGIAPLGLITVPKLKRLVITDFSFEACNVVKNVGDVVCCDAYNLPFTDSSFDTTLSSHVLEHVEEPADVIKEMVRVTRHRIIIVVPDYITSDKVNDYHYHSFSNIRKLDKFVYDACPNYPLKYVHMTCDETICCAIDLVTGGNQEVVFDVREK